MWDRVKRTAPQAVISAVYGLGDIIAGLILWLYFPTQVKWAALLYPPLIGARGAISGSVAGRLTSALNLGTVETNLRGENEKLWEILSTGVSASLLASVMIALPFYLMGIDADFPTLLAISLITVCGVSLILLPLKIAVSFESFRRGLDPDIVVYPLVSTAADIVVTILYIYSVRSAGTLTNLVFATAVAAISILLVVKWFSREHLRVLAEVLAATVIVIGIESVAGIFLNEAVSISDINLLFVYPAMLTELGDASSIVGSILTTRLFLGTLRSKIPLADILPELTGVFSVYLGFFFLMGGMLWALGGNPWVSVLTFLIAFPIMLIVTTSVVLLTSRKLDPDNFTIPIATSTADLVTTATVALVLSLL